MNEVDLLNMEIHIHTHQSQEDDNYKACPDCEGDFPKMSACCGAYIDSDILICGSCREHSELAVCETCNNSGRVAV